MGLHGVMEIELMNPGEHLGSGFTVILSTSINSFDFTWDKSIERSRDLLILIHSYSIRILGLIEANMKHLETITVFCVHILIPLTQHNNPGDIYIKNTNMLQQRRGALNANKKQIKYN